MIETTEHHEAGKTVWVVRPTRSLTWREAKRWLCLISVIPLSCGLLFLWFGVPVVLPFAGLEVSVELTRPGGWRPTLLRLRSHGRVVPLGEVLTDGEREWLARSLINALDKTR